MGASAKQPSNRYHHKKRQPLHSQDYLPSFRPPGFSAQSPLPSFPSDSNRRCLLLSSTLSSCIHTCTYRITSHSTPTSHRTSLCVPGWTGCYRAKCPFCQQGDLQTIHGRCTHSHLPPSYSLSLCLHRHTITSVMSFSMPADCAAG